MTDRAGELSTEEFNVSMQGHVAICEIRRPPHNYFDYTLIDMIANAFDALDEDPQCRAIVLAAAGKSFCAGANFGDAEKLDADGNAPGSPNRGEIGHLYVHAVRLFRTAKPIVGAIHGAAVGGGLGLALVPDFRVTCPEARFAANFTRLGIHPGFGLTVTLPRLIGHQKAAFVFLTARRFKGDEAVEMGLADILVPQDEVRARSIALAEEIATNAPLAVQSTRKTLRRGLADEVRAQTDLELEEQTWLRKTSDFREGVAATAARRTPDFTAS